MAACSIEVSAWDGVPGFGEESAVAPCCGGTCLRCQMDMDKQSQDQTDPASSVVVPRRSESNHMDPCFRFPADELKELFDHATVVEAMLVSLEHMQVNFVTVARSQLTKFRRNVISFPRDLPAFAARHDLPAFAARHGQLTGCERMRTRMGMRMRLRKGMGMRMRMRMVQGHMG